MCTRHWRAEGSWNSGSVSEHFWFKPAGRGVGEGVVVLMLQRRKMQATETDVIAVHSSVYVLSISHEATRA